MELVPHPHGIYFHITHVPFLIFVSIIAGLTICAHIVAHTMISSPVPIVAIVTDVMELILVDIDRHSSDILDTGEAEGGMMSIIGYKNFIGKF